MIVDHLKLPEEPLHDFPQSALEIGKEYLKKYAELRNIRAQLDDEVSEMMDENGDIHNEEGNVIHNHPKVVEYDEIDRHIRELETNSIYVILNEALRCMESRSRTIYILYERISELEEQLEQ